MRTYRELFRTPEFTPLFLTGAARVAAQTVTGLALGTVIYAETGSPLLAALAMFGPSLAQLIGATVLLSAADRLAPRATLIGLELAFAVATAAQAIPGLPVWGAFAILTCVGPLAALGGGVRYGLLNEILPAEGFVLGRSVLNMSVGTMQICGFALGGVLATVLSPRETLLAGAALYLAAAVVARVGLSRRAPRAAGRPSVAATWRGNARLWSSVPRRYVYLALWVPNGLIVGCESLFVSYDPDDAWVLFMAAALGMLAGDTVTGRFMTDRWRDRLAAPLRLLLGVPFLIFVLDPPLVVAVAAAALASVGYSASLLLQRRLLALTPEELSGHALGLQSAGMLAMQGVGAAIAGAVAQYTSPATAMTVMAAASVAVTVALARGLRTPVPGGPVDELRGVAVEGPALEQFEVEVPAAAEHRVRPGPRADHGEDRHLHPVDQAGGHERPVQ
jgi:predicted MFS family arabinose efflux permease